MSEVKSATPTVPTARVKLGGQEREFRFTIDSQMALENLTNRPWYDVLTEARLGFTRALVRLTWASMQHEAKSPKVTDVAGWIEELSHEERGAVISEVDRVVAASLPEKKEADEEEDPLDESA